MKLIKVSIDRSDYWWQERFLKVYMILNVNPWKASGKERGEEEERRAFWQLVGEGEKKVKGNV